MDKTYEAKQSEQQIKLWWEQENIYQTRRDGKTPLFSIDTPPPTVSGHLHIGHIFSYTQTDIIARYMRLQGHNVFYPFGFDDNGIPTERFVEKKHDVYAPGMNRSEFIALCLKETVIAEKQFEELWRRIGLSVDWSASYSTIDERARRIAQASFVDLYNKGYIYRKQEPALYCAMCRTSVSQADLEDVEKETYFNDVQFTTTTGEHLVIGTTRPELLASCVALFYHPTDTRYKHLQGQHAIVPLYEHQVPIMADDKVQVEKGTGLVMCCTFGDKTDIEWFKKHSLPYRQSIGLDGKMVEATGPLAGLKVGDARVKVIELLQQAGLLLAQKKITHTVNVYERSKREIEYVMLSQWFLKILPYKQEFLALADKLEWRPAFMKARFVDWVTNLQWDWCLSRQRPFGMPFPVWHDAKTGDIYVAPVESLPVDPQETAYPGTVPAGVELTPDKDVMDTWNISSLTPFICQSLFEQKDTVDFSQPTNFLPMGMRPQAHDIIRTWAFYTMVKAWMHNHTLPWKEIVISGHVLSSAKEKISKSKGNNPLDPENLLANYPADVIRYWTAAGSLGHDVAFSENTLKIGNKLLVKLWNACRFALEHLGGDNKTFARPEKLGVINEWILHRQSETFDRYNAYFAEREFGLALQTLESFFWQDLCDNYLEVIKFQFFSPERFGANEIAATRWTLQQTLLRTVQMFAPFVPFIAEALYQQMFKHLVGLPSIHATEFAQLQESCSCPNSVARMQHLLSIASQIRALKSSKQLSLRAELAHCTIIASAEVLEFLQTQDATIRGLTSAHVIAYVHETTGISHLEEVSGAWHGAIVVNASSVTNSDA